jgi:hypothetical protein
MTQALGKMLDAEILALVPEERRSDARALLDARNALRNVANEPIAPTELRLAKKRELAQLLDVSERAIENMVSDRRIPPEAVVRAGRRVRFDLPKVIEALRGKQSPASNAAQWARRVGRLRVVDGGSK